MEQIKIPDGYQSSLNLHDTQIAIKTVKDFFQQTLAQKLNLLRVSAPVFVNPSSGLNDNLNGVERPVSFDIKGQPENAEIVHSLAKWKRYALQKYGFAHGEGLYTDMIAIRRDEDLDNIHSVYVDQWDWVIADFVKFIYDRKHLFCGHTCCDLGLMSITENGFHNFNRFFSNSAIIKSPL